MNRILIAEDEARLAAFIEKGLGKSGLFSVVVPDGEQAVEMALTQEYELLLLDLGLPVKDGLTVLMEIRSQQSKLPIIIITAVNDDCTRLKAFKLGANDYVTKPFSFSDLLTRVKSQLANSSLTEQLK